MAEPQFAAVLLAAGRGTRMRSALPKVLHPIAGKPMLRHVIDAVRAAGVPALIAVVGHEAGRIRAALGPDVAFVEQKEQLGTGHALNCAREQAGGATDVLVVSGDVPLLRPETLRSLLQQHTESGATLTLLTARLERPGDLGRIVRDGGGRVRAIAEAADADVATQAIEEINAGAYCFRAAWLWPRLAFLPASAGGEYYLTALVEQAVREGAPVQTVTTDDPEEALGVNDREQLSRAEAVMRRRILRRLMLESGVTVIDPATTYVDADVQIGQDTVIEPNSAIRGSCVIGRNCVIGPGATLCNARIGDGCRIGASLIEDSELEAEVSMGPYGHIRGGARIGTGVELGDHVEIKNSRIGQGSNIHHFSYVGDAELGVNVNIGAGAVTCNYDGVAKHRTIIGDGAFIGSDTMLVAPVRIGHGAKTGAGSVVTHDVADGATVFGVPARPLRPDTETGTGPETG
ncbi:MAG: UDP-N-acetylglucosamine diphosphorylase/glucosamine-1-phosphate N-acetyltransferase [Dehalococcoidia bacterium]|nr:UDP-N-acetylglucosamine diphosphorylase/glucosamine-1-phosphate N-acetyltransferase [Dehalococcoidia bacterium]